MAHRTPPPLASRVLAALLLSLALCAAPAAPAPVYPRFSCQKFTKPLVVCRSMSVLPPGKPVWRVFAYPDARDWEQDYDIGAVVFLTVPPHGKWVRVEMTYPGGQKPLSVLLRWNGTGLAQERYRGDEPCGDERRPCAR